MELAEVVGPAGRVIAVDQSLRFLSALGRMRMEQGIGNISTLALNLDSGELPAGVADGAWSRWMLSFVKLPRDVLARIASALKPGGVLALHEYFDYSTWRTAPRTPELEEFVAAVMASWRETGGEPDIALSVPLRLEELGLEMRRIRPIVEVVSVDHSKWSWLRAFIEEGRYRLAELGYMNAERADAIWQAFLEFEKLPGSRVITPGVLELVYSKTCL
jgi:SAM-dependent methyltransferase